MGSVPWSPTLRMCLAVAVFAVDGCGRSQARGADSADGSLGDPARGRALVASGTYGCTGCHDVPGTPAPHGIVGPPLAGMAERAFIAGQLPNRPDILVAFLQDPPSLVPATGMPDVRLSLEDARHIAAYLYTLEPSRAR
jgi:cytochrome c2